MLYTRNIPCICSPPAYPWDITSLYLMGLFRTFFYNDMPMIYQVYSLNILDISLAYHYKKRYRTNPSGIDSLYPRDMRDIYIFNEYSLYIPCLYMVYT